MNADLTFTYIRLEDGSCKDYIGPEEKIGNKHIVMFYRSEELMEDRMSRLETRLGALETAHGALETAHGALETAHGALKARVDTSDQNILCGEIAYFIDRLAAVAAYGPAKADSRPISVGYLLSPWNDLTSEERARLDVFWARWRPAYTPHGIKKLTGLLRDARFPYAHLLERATKVDKKTFHGYISNQFLGSNASALHDLLNYIANEFSSDDAPLVER